MTKISVTYSLDIFLFSWTHGISSGIGVPFDWKLKINLLMLLTTLIETDWSTLELSKMVIFCP